VRLKVLTGGRWFVPLVIAVAVALVMPSVNAGLRGDDYVLLGILSASDGILDAYPARLDIFNFFDGDHERTRRLLDLGVLPWWTDPQIKMAFWRPVAALSHWVDAVAWRDRPELMHLQNVFWFAVLIAVTAHAYQRFMGLAPAAIATLFYALGAAHAGAVTWISARNNILGAIFGMTALILHDRWRRDGWRAGAFLAPACLGLALLSAESAIGAVAYLFAHAVCLEQGWRHRLTAITPHAIVAVAWQLTYIRLGYGVFGVAPAYLNPVTEPLQFAGSLVKNGPTLILAQWTGFSAEGLAQLTPHVVSAAWFITVLAIATLAVPLVPLFRRSPVSRFWGVGHVLAIVPICAGIPQHRYLLFVSLGAVGLLAQLTVGLFERAWRWPATALACALVIVHLVASPVRLAQSAVASNDTALERTIDSLTQPGQFVIVANTPSAVTVAFSFFVRAYKGQPIPKHTRVLSSGNGPVSLHRTDARSVLVRWQGRQERMLFRIRPFALHERIRLAGTDIEITGLTESGWPTEVLFRFDAELETLNWLRWEPGGFVDFRPPAVGKTIALR
jgi:hypothetical protein